MAINTSGIFGILSLIFLAVWISQFIRAHLQPDALNPVIYTVSEAGAHEPTKRFIATCWLCESLSGLSMALGLWFYSNGTAIGSTSCFGVYCASRILTWYFPTRIRWRDGTSEEISNHSIQPTTNASNRLHIVFATLSFASLSIGTVFTSFYASTLDNNSPLSANATTLRGIGIACTSAMVITAISRRMNAIGAGERLFYFVQLIAIATISILLIIS